MRKTILVPLLGGIGLVVAAATAWPLDNPPMETLSEKCACSCVGSNSTAEVAVIPTKQPPNEKNCKAMNNKGCYTSKTGSATLKCEGKTVVTHPAPVVFDNPVVLPPRQP